jgi:hypothetical protein
MGYIIQGSQSLFKWSMDHKVKSGNILQGEYIEKHEMLFGVL